MMQNTEHTAAPLLVRGGRVHDAVHPEPQQIDLLLENGRIVARICYEPGVVKWCSTVPASGEPDCAFKDGMTLEVLDADGSLLGVETTFHTEWDGGGLALADFASPIK